MHCIDLRGLFIGIDRCLARIARSPLLELHYLLLPPYWIQSCTIKERNGLCNSDNMVPWVELALRDLPKCAAYKEKPSLIIFGVAL